MRVWHTMMWLELPWLSAEQRAHKRHARAIKQLGSQSSSIQSLAGQWRNSHGRLQPKRVACSTPSEGTGASGHQAEMRLSGSNTSVAVKLPPGLRISATRDGKIDLRLQLFSVKAEWPSAAGPALPEVAPAPSPALGFACRTGALLLLHLLFPDHTTDVVSALAVPVACWDTATAVAQASPAPVRRAAARAAGKLGGVYGRLERRGEARGLRLGWLRGAGGTARAGMHTLHSLSGPAAAVAFGSYTWAALAPSSHQLLQCIVALMAVSADYNKLGRDAAQGRIAPGKELEGAWRACHKRSAGRVAHYLGDLPRSPPLGRALDAYARLSIAAAVMCDGGALAGLPADLGSAWAAGSRSGDTSRLAVSASIDLRPKSVKQLDQHTNIERTKLLELFTGSALAGSADTALSGLISTAAGSDQRPDGPPNAPGTSYGGGGAAAQPSPALNKGQRSPASVYDSASSSPHGGRRLMPSPFSAAAATPELPLAQAVQRVPSDPTVFAAAPITVTTAGGSGGGAADPLAFLHELQLYGRADHGGSPIPSGVADRASLALRAAYLLLVFSPFLMFGLPMLLLSWNMLRRVAAVKAREAASAAIAAAQAGAVVPRAAVADADANELSAAPSSPVAAIMLWLLNVLSAMVEAVLALAGGRSREHGRAAAGEAGALRMRGAAWKLLLGSMSSAGAAFIKWGQWSATRRDLFPDDLCEMLSTLHDHAPVHSTRHSRRAIQLAFGAPPEVLFSSFSDKPLASGSVAQVHLATLRDDDGRASSGGSSGSSGRGARVVVKVLHPGVAKRIAQDFRILGPIAEWAGRFKALKGLSLKESVSQFSATMTAQADLRVEAVHAQRFADNFEGIKHRTTVPRPVPGFVHSTVLVETFEEGHSVARYMKQPGPLNTQIVALGVDAYLKMLLKDNFVHTDLHPGNIMVRALPVSPLTTSSASGRVRQQQQHQGWQEDEPEQQRPQLVFLDFGLAEELTPAVRHRFISFLNFIMAGDGLQAARHLLQWSQRQTCPNRRAFAADMQALFVQRCNIHSLEGIDLDNVLKDVLRLARKHEVAIDSSYASLVIAVCVLVGFAASLDPSVNLADAAAPCLLAYSLTGRIIGRVY